MIKLIFTLLFMPLVSYATILTDVPQCTQSEMSRDPISIVPIYQITYWKDLLDRPENKALFNPVEIDNERRASGIERTELSSSHIVNLVVEGIKSVEKKTNELVALGELKPLLRGVTYSEQEQLERRASQKAAYERHLSPLLQELYKVYTNALVRRLDQHEVFQPSPASEAFKSRVRKQVDVLNTMIKQTAPESFQKLGSVIPVTDNNLPLSFHGGYVSKIRFRNSNDPRNLTLYPTLLLNQIMKDDFLFLQAMEMWKDYTEARKRVAESVGASSGIGYYWNYFTTLTSYKWGWEKEHPDELIRTLPIKRRAFELAAEDYEGARWVHDKMENTYTRYEIYALLDLFRALRYDDMPKCQRQISQLYEKMRTMMGGQLSTRNMSDADEAVVERFGKDVNFYHDQYRVFSTASAQKAVENGMKY